VAELSAVEVAQAYEKQRPLYETLVTDACERFAEALRKEGIYAQVTGRVKETDTFVTKALVGNRYADPLNEIADKVGIRAVLAYDEHVDPVEGIARRLFDVIHKDQKLDALAYNENGYLGVHLDARLYAADAARLGAELGGLIFEIQIRTIAQSAWAEVSHQQLYKPPVELPDPLKRRIYRLVSLVELFDNEVQGFLDEARGTPGFAEADAVAPLRDVLLNRFDRRYTPDRRLSLAMAAALVPLYDCEPSEVFARLQVWIVENEDGLRNVLDEAAETTVANPLLRQPECFLLFERLDNDRARVVEAWPEGVPEDWLREAAQAWGVAL
jgi:ppGpp synthetase/RelA/SpoT-type nucleotidyltranferase